MGMKDPILSKYYEGTLAGGEEDSKWKDLKFVGEGETKGVYGGEGKRITMVSGPGGDSRDGKEEPGFKLNSKDYAGAENWQPKDAGVCNPDDIQRG